MKQKMEKVRVILTSLKKRHIFNNNILFFYLHYIIKKGEAYEIFIFNASRQIKLEKPKFG